MDFSVSLQNVARKLLEYSMMSKRLILVAILLMSAGFGLSAQTPVGEEYIPDQGYELGLEVQLDSSILGMDIFSTLPEGIIIRQSPQLRQSVISEVESNESKIVNGYRIRLYIGSSRDARNASLAVLNKFNSLYPYINAYRSYSSPNFKVTAGSFRNRVEAERLLREIKGNFPDAFIVRDKFRFPSMGTPNTSPLLPEDDPALREEVIL